MKSIDVNEGKLWLLIISRKEHIYWQMAKAKIRIEVYSNFQRLLLTPQDIDIIPILLYVQ
jgi:hypothetical protein